MSHLAPAVSLGVLLVCCAGNARGQARQFRGPGDLVTPALRTAPVADRGGIGADLSRWQSWWETRKDAFLVLPRSPLAGTARADLLRLASKRLAAALAAAETPELADLAAACVLGLARLAAHEPAAAGSLPRWLADPRPRVRASAVLALGVAGRRADIDPLAPLALDAQAGRERLGTERVPAPTRARAAYALAVLAQRERSLAARTRVLAILQDVLETSGADPLELRAAAIDGLGLLGTPPGERSAGELSFCRAGLRVLETAYDRDRDAAAAVQVVRAHVLTAVAGLLGRGPDDLDDARDRFVARLRTELDPPQKTGPRPAAVVRAAILALGRLCRPGDEASRDALVAYLRGGRDGQARHFALIALARIGGEPGRRLLLDLLASSRSLVLRPWLALALGIVARDLRARGSLEAADDVAGALASSLGSRNPDVLTATALGVGLSGYRPAASRLRELLEKYPTRDEQAGYTSLALALLGDRAALGPLRELADHSARRPERHRQLALALAALGDDGDADRLVAALGAALPDPTRMGAAAVGLAALGGPRQAAALADLVDDRERDIGVRAAAATALSYLAIGDPRPWNAELAQQLDYRSAGPVLLGSDGVLMLY